MHVLNPSTFQLFDFNILNQRLFGPIVFGLTLFGPKGTCYECHDKGAEYLVTYHEGKV